MSDCLAPLPAALQPRHRANARYAQSIARRAVGCLHAELLLYPKPGLVSPVDNGSHHDMNAATFMRSLFALRHYFAAVGAAGAADAPFALLRELGIRAEARMLKATVGINTHRGAIFSLGLLCAALGRVNACGMKADAASVRRILMLCWGEQLAAHAEGGAAASTSHGSLAALRHGAGGAREQAALGFPAVFDLALPVLRATLAAGRGIELARIDALFALMAQVADTNVLYRGGAGGAAFVRESASDFLARGGTAAADWRTRAIAIHHAFVARRLSPGGAADLLAATCLVHGCMA